MSRYTAILVILHLVIINGKHILCKAVSAIPFTH